MKTAIKAALNRLHRCGLHNDVEWWLPHSTSTEFHVRVTLNEPLAALIRAVDALPVVTPEEVQAELALIALCTAITGEKT